MTLSTFANIVLPMATVAVAAGAAAAHIYREALSRIGRNLLASLRITN